jgi:hypothetical protein
MILILTLLVTTVLHLGKNKISSFDEINVSTINELKNVDLITKNKNRMSKSRKIKRAVPSEWKGDKTTLLRNAGHAN